jgi:hypothetical protein
MAAGSDSNEQLRKSSDTLLRLLASNHSLTSISACAFVKHLIKHKKKKKEVVMRVGIS